MSLPIDNPAATAAAAAEYQQEAADTATGHLRHAQEVMQKAAAELAELPRATAIKATAASYEAEESLVTQVALASITDAAWASCAPWQRAGFLLTLADDLRMQADIARGELGAGS